MTTPDDSTSATLHIEPITIDDIPKITELWYTVFGSPEMLRLFPDTPGLRQWWDNANRHDLQHKPAQKYLKAVDETGKMVAYAKWDLAVQERGERFPPWHAESDQEACERFFGGLDEGRERLVGVRKCYYLDMLGTHPGYRRRGAASMLISWGCELADRDGVVAYVDASPAGAPLYQKFGFEGCRDPGLSTKGVVAMVREAR